MFECLLKVMLNCKIFEELEYVFVLYKIGSKGIKVQRVRQLGLEGVVRVLFEKLGEFSLLLYIRFDVKGFLMFQDIEIGVQHILVDMIVKDKDMFDFIWNLCQKRYVCIQLFLVKVFLKKVNEKDVDKFLFYQYFFCNIRNIYYYQILVINCGENLKVLMVKVNIFDGVKDEFCRWCI